VIAHTPFTCAPIFAARLATPDGTPVLRLYEWERIRRAAYQIDAYLPDGSPVLYVRVKLVNPFDHALPMYWWSNIAVPEAEDVRVLVPAAESYQYALSVENLKTVGLPVVDGVDVSYTTRSKRAADYFFLIPPGQRPWVTALDAEGKGLIQASTGVLRGRKLFLWGTGQGGTRWQQWLSGDRRYLEIQAGLAQTQVEYALMPARAEISWLEAYGLMEADAGAVHGDDWAAARAAVETRLDKLSPRAAFETEYIRGELWENQPPDEILHRGSGWGALEAMRREKAGEKPFASAGLDFSGAVGTAQQPWIDLLKTERFPDAFTDAPIAGVLAQPEWRAMLEKAVEADGSSWEAWLHLGVMRLHDGDADGARQAWETSLGRKRTPWALRNLAVLARRAGENDQAAKYYLQAQKLRPDLLPLLVETGRALIDAGIPGEFLALLATLPPEMQNHGRVHLLEIEAGLAAGDLERVGRLFDAGFEIVDYQEGDEILTDLWFRYHAERIALTEGVPADEALRARAEREHPLPAQYDFRMSVE
jgi:hypothetical protein